MYVLYGYGPGTGFAAEMTEQNEKNRIASLILPVFIIRVEEVERMSASKKR